MYEIPGYALTAKHSGHVDAAQPRLVALTERERAYLLLQLGNPADGIARSIKHKLQAAPTAPGTGRWTRLFRYLMTFLAKH